MIIERLARRCGYEALEPHIPEAHRKLLTHIRKQNTRKERRKSEAGSQVGVRVAGLGWAGLAGLATPWKLGRSTNLLA